MPWRKTVRTQRGAKASWGLSCKLDPANPAYHMVGLGVGSHKPPCMARHLESWAPGGLCSGPTHTGEGLGLR